MAPIHVLVKRLLLIGAARPLRPPPPPALPPPAALRALAADLAVVHRRLDAVAVRHGHRYRSAFWSSYLLSAVAVLFGALPPALGWDQRAHSLHAYVWFWGLCELATIASVGVLYWLGHRGHWQAQWLAARSDAELVSYLPIVAPLLDPDPDDGGTALPSGDWYGSALGSAQAQASATVAALCDQFRPQAIVAARAWGDAAFAPAYAAWVGAHVTAQRHYHTCVAADQHALLHRVHTITAWLFGLTAAGALAHLAWHTLWLSLVTLFCPALGAALHGALAQSEAYRLQHGSQQLVARLGRSLAEIDRARTDGDTAALRLAIRETLDVLLAEHQDWHGLVKPHDLPLG